MNLVSAVQFILSADASMLAIDNDEFDFLLTQNEKRLELDSTPNATPLETELQDADNN